MADDHGIVEDARNFRLTDFPNEILEMIFSNLSEHDLCRVAQTCNKFRNCVNDSKLWEWLYKDVYQYELPLVIGSNPREIYFNRNVPAGASRNFNGEFPGMQIEPWDATKFPSQVYSGPRGFLAALTEFMCCLLVLFIFLARSVLKKGHRRLLELCRRLSELYQEPPAQDDEQYVWKKIRYHLYRPVRHVLSYGGERPVENPWKRSFRQLYRAVHVRPNYELAKKLARPNVRYVDSVEDALRMCDDEGIHENDPPLVLIHAGIYNEQTLTVTFPVIMLGCGPGWNPAESVVIEVGPYGLSCIEIRDGSGYSYLGYLTVRQVSVALRNRRCIHVGYGTAPIIDHCVIRPVAKGIDVFGAEPIVRHCDISDCQRGITITASRGLYEKNRIARCTNAGIHLLETTMPIIRENDLQDCHIVRWVLGDDSFLECLKGQP